METVKLHITPHEYGHSLDSLKLDIRKGRYENGRLALILMDVDSNQRWCVLTVNLPEEHLEEGEFFVKAWAENEPTARALLEQTNLFIDTGRKAPTGFVEACVWRFKDPNTIDQLTEVRR